MAKSILCISVFLLLKSSCLCQSYGLMFNSHEVVLEKRTSLDLSPNDSFCLAKNFELSFEFSFLRNYAIYFGYVLRVVSNENENIDLIYNQPSATFKVISGENFSGISFNIDSLGLYKNWNNVILKFDLEKQTLQCTVNNRLIGTSKLNIKGNCFKFLWGANDFQKFKTRDIPPMQIKDIRISEKNKPRYYWPLDETSGNEYRDKIEHKEAGIKNPVWVKNQHQKWETLGSFTINGYAGVAFDPGKDQLYITGSDSLAIYTLKNVKNLEFVPGFHQNLRLGHQSIYDTLNEKLLDEYPDDKKAVAMDFLNHRWEYIFPSHARITEYWHSNKFISPRDTSLYIIGGYGYLRYKNLVQRYNFSTRRWDMLTPSGDYFTPRYLSAVGLDAKGQNAYILGGYGSQTGDQMLDPKYFYDLFRYDIKGNSFKKICTFRPQNAAFTFANSLILDSTDYYGLVFPNDSYNSSLQLVKGSLKDSTLYPLSEPIPYNFHDIQSFADLYYSPLSNKLIVVTLFYTPENVKEQRTDVKIYSLNFPPEPMGAAPDTETVGNKVNWLLLVVASLALVSLFVFLARKKSRAAKQAISSGDKSELEENLTTVAPVIVQVIPEKPPQSSIYLFGQFQVFDREGNDITRLFTPLLKELFLIIAIYTMRNGRGISSEELNEILWHNKSDKDAKNNRSVNIVKLKTILEKIGNCAINKKSGFWQLESEDEEMYIDYKKYVSLTHTPSETNKNHLSALIEIIKRGAFLAQTEYNWLDDVKSEISNFVINACLTLIKSQDISKDPEFIIEITNYIFYFDKLNEDALIYKCKSLILLKRHTLANNAYQKFSKEYKDIYGEDFGKPFHEIIN
jgi:two-component SAPR family response regulator